MEKTFCDVCGVEITKERGTGYFSKKHMPEGGPVESWGLRKYDLCPTCAITVEEFVRALDSKVIE